jgi:hypothetical protein
MSDLKSKLPDLDELSTMATKLYKDIKSSVCEIIDDYKLKHPDTPEDLSTPQNEEKPVVTEIKLDDVKKDKL